jgi:hypothetical protein
VFWLFNTTGIAGLRQPNIKNLEVANRWKLPQRARPRYKSAAPVAKKPGDIGGGGKGKVGLCQDSVPQITYVTTRNKFHTG